MKIWNLGAIGFNPVCDSGLQLISFHIIHPLISCIKYGPRDIDKAVVNWQTRDKIGLSKWDIFQGAQISLSH